jgi:hypothetical protein
MLKYFIQTSILLSRYHDLVGWFNITIEPDANHEYTWLVRSISSQFIF